MHTGLEFWIGFNAVVLLLLALDLFVFHRKAVVVSFRDAAFWSAAWFGLSLSFNALVWRWKGADKALEFLTGYLIEYALSVDNIFVFGVIFTYFKVRAEYQHRVLFWGILGALLMRGAMIALGVELVTRFRWSLYVFGAFLLLTGVRMFFKKESESPMENGIVRFCRRWLRVTPQYHGAQFFVRLNGAWVATPLALVLIVVELTDLVFAVDSIPAIFAVTTDPFIVYTSNICAILGLRSLYFLLAGLADRFRYLQYGLAAVLSFIGVKMLIAFAWHIPIALSLGIVALCLMVSIVASIIKTRHEKTSHI
jgi:tellurite resistance protein TerC